MTTNKYILNKEVLDEIEKVNEEIANYGYECKFLAEKLLNDIEAVDAALYRKIIEISKTKTMSDLISKLVGLVNYLEQFDFLNTFRKNNKKVALWTNNAEEGLFDNKDYANIANIESISYMWDVIIFCVNKNFLDNADRRKYEKEVEDTIWDELNDKVKIAHLATKVFIKAIPSKQLKTLEIFIDGKKCRHIKLESALAMYELPVFYKRLSKEQKPTFKKYKEKVFPFTTSVLNENYDDPITLKPESLSLKTYVEDRTAEDIKESILENNSKKVQRKRDKKEEKGFVAKQSDEKEDISSNRFLFK